MIQRTDKEKLPVWWKVDNTEENCMCVRGRGLAEGNCMRVRGRGLAEGNCKRVHNRGLVEENY